MAEQGPSENEIRAAVIRITASKLFAHGDQQSLFLNNGSLWAISAADYTSRHQLVEINPAHGSLVRQLFVSLPSDGGLYLGVGGPAWQ